MTLGNEDTEIEVSKISRQTIDHLELDGSGNITIPNGDLGISNGQSIVDGNSNLRVTFTSGNTVIRDEDEAGGLNYGRNDNFVYFARSGKKWVIEDAEGSFNALEYSTSPNTGEGTLTLRANTNQGGPLNMSTSDAIQDSGTDAIQFNGSAQTTFPNEATFQNGLTSDDVITVASADADTSQRIDFTDGNGNISFLDRNSSAFRIRDANVNQKLTVEDGGRINFHNAPLNFPNSNSIQDSGTDAIQFDGSANVTIPNGGLTISNNSELLNLVSEGTNEHMTHVRTNWDSGDQFETRLSGPPGSEKMKIRWLDNSTSTSTEIAKFNSDASVEIPNGDLEVGGGVDETRSLDVFTGGSNTGNKAQLGAFEGSSVGFGFYFGYDDNGNRGFIDRVDNNESDVRQSVMTFDRSTSNVTIPNGDLTVANSRGTLYEDTSLTGSDKGFGIRGGGSAYILIDSNNGGSGAQFSVGTDASTIGSATELLNVRDSGNVEIPNGNLLMGDGVITGNQGNLDLGEAGTGAVAIDTSGTGSGYFRVNDVANGQTVFRAREGGNVEIPNGDLTISSGDIFIDRSIRDNETNAEVLEVVDGGGETFIHTNPADGTGVVHLWDQNAAQDILTASEGGNVEIPNGDLSVDGSTLYDASANYIPQGRLQNDSITINGGTDITAGTVSLGGSVTVSHANTSGQGNVATGGATVIDDIDLDGNGHVTNLNTENRSLDDWTAANAAINIGGNDIHNVRQIDGSSGNHRIRFDSSTNWIEITDQSNNRQDFVAKDVFIDDVSLWLGDDTIVTVAGNSINLGGSTAINHADLSNISSNDHHSRYTDSEAVSAVEGGTFNELAFNNIEDPSTNRSIGIDDSEGLLFKDASGNTFPVYTNESVNIGTDLTRSGGSGAGSTPITIDHADTSSQGNVSAGAGAAITDINLDGRGHTTSISVTDFDNRFVNEGGDTMSGQLTLNGGLNMNGNTATNFGFIEMDGDISGGGVDIEITEVTRIRGPNNGGTQLDLQTQGSGSHEIRLFDGANNQSILTANEGGLVQIPNGDLNVDGSTLYDASANYIPQNRLQNDTITVNGGTDINGGSGALGGSVTVDHADTSSQSNVSASSGNAITDINLDGRGHVTSIGTSSVGGNTFGTVNFTDADGDGNTWEITEDGTNGHLNFNSSGGGGTQMDIEHNGNVRIEGTITENSSL